jgi:hypothetical protein
MGLAATAKGACFMPARRVPRLVLAGLPLLLMAPQRTSPPPAAPAGTTPLLRRVELIEPGTVIERSAPRGWSHLILKSQPSLPESQRRLVSDNYARLATFVFTATAAHVEADGAGPARRYRLARLGYGVGVNIDGKDVIVSPDTQARLGANLGFLAGRVLAGVCEKQNLIRLVAAGPTAAVVDTPAFMPRGRGHAAVVMRYVYLVDARTGKLDTLVWRIDTDGRGGYDGATGFIEWLPPNKMVDAKMQVDLSEFRLGIPSEKAFAVTSIPTGQRQFSIPDGLRAVAGAPKLTGEEATRLIATLREMIRTAGASASR